MIVKKKLINDAPAREIGNKFRCSVSKSEYNRSMADERLLLFLLKLCIFPLSWS